MHPLRRIADGLTWFRAALALVILLVGITQGYDGLELGLTLLVIAWVTDGLDGALARSSGEAGTSWIGAHDPLVDILLNIAVWVLLTTAGLVHPIVAGVYLGVWGIVFWRHRGYRPSEPAIFGGIISAWTIIQALRHVPRVGWALILWLVVDIAAGWYRIWYVRFPQFCDNLNALLYPPSRQNK